MTARDHEVYNQYRALQDSGWRVENTASSVRFNDGSETLRHRVAKMVAASVCIDAGYRVRSEVETSAGNEADVLAFGLHDRRPIAIELENDVDAETVEGKLDAFNVGPVREVFVADLDEAPEEPEALYDHIAAQTGLGE